MLKQIVLVGGGGHCRSVIEAAESAGRSIVGILDMPENFGKEILFHKVIGTDDDIPNFVSKAEFVITVGFVNSPAVRIRLYKRIRESGGKLATIIASTAYVSQYATVGDGTVVLHHAFVNAGAQVGSNVILNTGVNIEHDTVIGDHCHVSTGVMINGGCVIGARCFVGSQSVLVNNISLGDDIIIGAGSLVRRSIWRTGVYGGNPLTYLKSNGEDDNHS